MRNKEDWEILYTLATNEGLKKKDVRYEQAYDNIVNLFYEKDKIIDLMARAFKQDNVRTVEEIKQYFADLARKEKIEYADTERNII